MDEPVMSGATPDDEPSTEVPLDESRRKLLVDGQYWFVREVAAPSFDRRGGTHLLFETLEVIRRVRVFPSGWRDLSDEELYALSLDLRPRRDAEVPERRPPH